MISHSLTNSIAKFCCCCFFSSVRVINDQSFGFSCVIVLSDSMTSLDLFFSKTHVVNHINEDNRQVVKVHD